MANFGDAFKKLSIKEGGYVNDKDDAGGETYKGISRRYNPTWQGWTMIDSYKSDTTISADYFIAKYKLERIRYYNNIAGKGNNIKFLRGWINRVLNE